MVGRRLAKYDDSSPVSRELKHGGGGGLKVGGL